MSNSAYQPRRDDHLVEPFFGGLGVEEAAAERPGPRGWRRALRALFARLWRRV